MSWRPTFTVAVLTCLIAVAGCSASDTETEDPTLGILLQGSALVAQYEDFKAAMAELGYIEGESIQYLFNGPVIENADLESSAEQVVAADPDVVVTWTSSSALAMDRALGPDSAIPHLFSAVTDPVGSGVVDSLEQPGHNTTGVGGSKAPGKALEWLNRATGAKTVVVPHDPANAGGVSSLKIVRNAADALNITLDVVEVSSAEEIGRKVPKAAKQSDAMFYLTSSFVSENVDQLNAIATAADIPIGNSAAPLAKNPGVLISYADTSAVRAESLALLTDAVIHGANAGDLPVADPEAFLTVNLERASELGITIPAAVVSQADTVLR